MPPEDLVTLTYTQLMKYRTPSRWFSPHMHSVHSIKNHAIKSELRLSVWSTKLIQLKKCIYEENNLFTIKKSDLVKKVVRQEFEVKKLYCLCLQNEKSDWSCGEFRIKECSRLKEIIKFKNYFENFSNLSQIFYLHEFNNTYEDFHELRNANFLSKMR